MGSQVSHNNNAPRPPPSVHRWSLVDAFQDGRLELTNMSWMTCDEISVVRSFAESESGRGANGDFLLDMATDTRLLLEEPYRQHIVAPAVRVGETAALVLVRGTATGGRAGRRPTEHDTKNRSDGSLETRDVPAGVAPGGGGGPTAAHRRGTGTLVCRRRGRSKRPRPGAARATPARVHEPGQPGRSRTRTTSRM